MLKNKLIVPPSAAEMAVFVAELREEEIHVLGCGGGTITDLAWSVGWLRWNHGKRKLLRLAVYLFLSAAPDDPAMEDVLGRTDHILFRYGDRRLLRELLGLREEWAERTVAPDQASEDVTRRLSRLDELLVQIRQRLQVASRQ